MGLSVGHGLTRSLSRVNQHTGLRGVCQENLQCERIEMNKREVSLSASFMSIGYASACAEINAGSNAQVIKNGWGRLETIDFLVQVAERLEALYSALPEDIRDSATGVWAYDVAKPLGFWFGKESFESIKPSMEMMDVAMAKLAVDFFKPPERNSEEVKQVVKETLAAINLNPG